MESMAQIRLNTRRAGSYIMASMVNHDNHNVSNADTFPRGSLEGTQQNGYETNPAKPTNELPFNRQTKAQSYGRGVANGEVIIPSALERVRRPPKRKGKSKRRK